MGFSGVVSLFSWQSKCVSTHQASHWDVVKGKSWNITEAI